MEIRDAEVDDAGLDISTPVLWNQDAAFGPTS
jgi:hypothetical protein